VLLKVRQEKAKEIDYLLISNCLIMKYLGFHQTKLLKGNESSEQFVIQLAKEITTIPSPI
jgi:hypothetical protein